ncbi:MAG: hypothetical protein A2V98_05590 [Planctomycetes bacterium RBG_16_64_12]|nr:MAG: hypothetical protein A2V98_05590 [Planctomycetes bacterium RBG_16_64_12]
MKRSSLVTLGLVLAVCGLTALALTGCGNSAAQTEAAQSGEAEDQPKASASNPSPGSGSGMAAIKQASEAGKYLFIFLSKADDDQTLAMRKVFDQAMEKVADRAQSVAVDIADASETAIVDKFDLSRAPMPLVLALAPNGAITGGFPTQFDEQQLVDAFATPGTEKVMKSLQDGKLVFVCVQNGTTISNDAALQGVRDFKADVRYASATEIVTLDPSDQAEAGFLTDLQVPSDTKEAVTIFVVPPGQAIGKIEGATNKDALIELLSKANTGCGPGGCGPGGCGPRK